MLKFRRITNIGYLYILPIMLVLLIVNIYPVIYEIYISLTSYRLGDNTATFVGLANYARLFLDKRFLNSIFVILKFLLIVIPLELVLGLVIAEIFYHFHHRKYVLPLLIIPVVVTPVVWGFMFQYMYRADYGLISYFLRLVHLFPGFNLTANTGTALWALAIPDILQWTPFVVLILLAGLDSISPSVHESAMIDGASFWHVFKWIDLPLIRAQIAIVLLFRTVDSIKIFDTIFAMTRGGPGISSESVSIYLRLVAFNNREIAYAAAIGLFLVFLGSFFAQIYLKLFKSDTEFLGKQR